MEEYKESGIDWIGIIPKHWNLTKNKYSITICNGKEINSESGNIPVYGTGGVFKNTNDYLYNGESVLLGRKGTIDKPLYVNDKFWTVDTMFYTKINKTLIPKFFYYLALCFDYKYYQTGTTLPSMTQTDLGNIYIPKIAIKEQNDIIKYLDKIVPDINFILENLNKQISILTQYKSTLVTEVLTKGLNPNVELKDSGISGIGKIPKHWSLKKIKYLLKDLKVGPFGSALSGEDFKDEGYWVYNQRVVLDKNFKNNDVYIDENKYNDLKSFKVFPNDILITTRGTIGKVAIVPSNAPDGILHPCIIRFVLDNTIIKNKLIELIFNESNLIYEQIYKQSNATTIEVIYSYTLKELILPIIPIEEQKQLIDYLSSKCMTINSLINDKQSQIDKLQTYKKSIIYEYVTGKKRVKGE